MNDKEKPYLRIVNEEFIKEQEERIERVEFFEQYYGHPLNGFRQKYGLPIITEEDIKSIDPNYPDSS